MLSRAGRIGGACRRALLAAMLLWLPACREFQDHRLALDRLHEAGLLDRADQLLADPRVERLYEPRSRVLLDLERGALALALDRPDDALLHLEQAERRIDAVREQSPADIVAQWLLSDSAVPYLASPWEDLYVNVLKMLAQYQRGRIDGGVTVEARRMARKADLLRDRYLQVAAELRARGGPALDDALRQLPVLENPEGQFIESPLGIYLSALAFMQVGETEFQRVAERRLLEALEVQRGLVGEIDPERFRGIGTLEKDRYNVLVVALSGRGPTRAVDRVGPVPILSLPVYLELPRLVVHPSPVTDAVVHAAGLGAPVRLDLIEDLSSVAEENHRRQLPQIRARAVLRSMLKAGGMMVATEAVARQQSRENRDLVRVLGGLAGLGVLVATEHADLRCWSFLPGQARVGLLALPPGRHTLAVEFLGPGGTIRRAEREVDVAPGTLRAVVVHCGR